jgi:hypothetical protein
VRRPQYADVWFRLEELAKYDNFVLAGLAVNNRARRWGYQIEYVHSKVERLFTYIKGVKRCSRYHSCTAGHCGRKVVHRREREPGGHLHGKGPH